MKTNTLKGVILSLVFILVVPHLSAQDDVKVEATKITESVYMLTGRGGNIGLCVGEDGVFMVDDQYANMSEKILTAIKEITDKPAYLAK